MRTAEAGCDTEALTGPDDEIGAERTGGGDEHQCERIADDDGERASGVKTFDHRRDVAQRTRRAGVGEQRREARHRIEVSGRIADDDLDADRLGSRLHDGDRLRVSVDVDEEAAFVGVLGQPPRHRHRFRRRRAFVEHRGVGQIEAGEVSDHRLKVEQRLEPTLADLGLVGRVGGVPRRVLQHVALDHRWRDRRRVAHPDQRGEHVVLSGERSQLRDRLLFRQRRGERQRLTIADRGGHDLIDQLGDGTDPERGEHLGSLAIVHADMATDEVASRIELGEQRQFRHGTSEWTTCGSVGSPAVTDLRASPAARAFPFGAIGEPVALQRVPLPSGPWA